jgi:copper chaperone CopZ
MKRVIGLPMFLMMVPLLSLPAFNDVAAEVEGSQTTTLQIEGMTCGACVKDVRAALQKVAGVTSVEVQVGTKWVFFSDYTNAHAVVTFDPGQTDVDALIKAIESASRAISAYKAHVLETR